MSNSDSVKKAKAAATKSMMMDWSGGDGLIPGRDALGPLFLMTVTPCFSIVFYHIFANCQGDVQGFLLEWLVEGKMSLLDFWPNPWNPVVWQAMLVYMVFQSLLMKVVPGARFEASRTPTGHIPVYKANGMASYVLTLALLLGLSSAKVVRLAWVYDHFGEILSSLNVFAWVFCFGLLIKGHVSPSTADSGSNNGSWVHDFYWGMDLYPRLFGWWDVKQFTNCRCGMMFWAVAILCFADKNRELQPDHTIQLGMAVNVALQLVYISKFFHWEMGYMCSMDIQHDRAGYYLCWGCLVWVPSVYTSHSFALVQQAPTLTPPVALLIFLAGLICIYINYDSDQQRYVFRQTHGMVSIWGKSPKPNHIVAEYSTKTGAKHKSLLLVDGWWKYSRHFHYVPEVLASLFWSLPALNVVWPAYFYVFYLSILLTDRAYRDDDRCSKKYGPYWQDYCNQVPYKIIPGVV